ncbi:hypothetical protein [Microvirga solisilvae]|uniref:hypothetical protein n=1 Tax=Microvirga solisilvae TaxID=2919498 RepID=UPI001FAFBC32|nr:hypothetical protein [Microvirga solisilvae]
MDQEVEFVARALYEAEDDAMLWEAEPEILKEEFRRYARAAIAMLPRQDGKKQKTDFPHAA